MKKLTIYFAIFIVLVFNHPRTTFAVSNSPIFIKAINPGYTVDGTANVGEFIELAKAPDVATPFSLAGFVLSYTNSSGNSVILYEFPERSWMTGESILLRLASSPESELADQVYTKTLALKAGPLVLTKDETIYDLVCWNNRDGCLPDFKSSSPTTLLRDEITGEFAHVSDYEPTFTTSNYYVEPPVFEEAPTPEEPALEEPTTTEPTPEPAPNPVVPLQCVGLKFSEIFTYYESDSSEQFIEFVNTTDETLSFDACQIKYKNKLYPLVGTVSPGDYFVRELPDFTLTKNPIRSNLIELIDSDGTIADSLTYPTGQKKAAAYAAVLLDGTMTFAVTYNVTPGAANIYQPYRNCAEGTTINPDTGKCVKNATVTTIKTCPEGSYLNPATNRCKKLVVNDGADYSIVATAADSATTEKASFIALTAVLAALGTGLIFFIFEFRQEIKKFFGRVYQRVLRKPRPALDHR